MTTIATQTQEQKEPPTEVSVASTIFPQEIKVPLKLRILVSSQEERDCWLDAGTNNISTSAVADFLDALIDEGFQILSINDLTREQLQKILSERN